jgi:hypothetical protein
MAQAPGTVRFNLTIDEMKQSYDQSIAPKMQRQMEAYSRKYAGF